MKKGLLVILIAILVIIGGYALYAAGQKAGEKTIEEKLMPALNAAYPAPPEEFYGLTGKITAINGNEISFEIRHPDDYLPTEDPRTQIRTAIVTDETEIKTIDFSTINDDGTIPEESIEISDLSEGMTITATSSENIKNKNSFNAKAISTVLEIQ